MSKKIRLVLLFALFLGHVVSSQTISEKSALLLIDIQEFYFPEGAVPLYEPEKAAANAAMLLGAFREKGLSVVHVKHKFGQGGEIHALVFPLQHEKVITKSEVNSFKNTDLLAYLKSLEITTLVIAGMQTHMCVEAAVRAAKDYGFECVVAADACATRDLKHDKTVVPAAMVHAASLATLNRTYARVISTDLLISELTDEE